MEQHGLLPRIKEFMVLHPGIEIELIFDDKELDLSTRQADIAIRMRRPKQLNLYSKKINRSSLSYLWVQQIFRKMAILKI